MRLMTKDDGSPWPGEDDPVAHGFVAKMIGEQHAAYEELARVIGRLRRRITKLDSQIVSRNDQLAICVDALREIVGVGGLTATIAQQALDDCEEYAENFIESG